MLNNNSLKVTPIRVAETIRKTHIKLGLLTGENGELHYFLIKNLSAFVGSQISSHHARKLFCERCLNPFRVQSALDKHMLSCSKFKPVREIFPEGDRKTLNFTKYEYQLPVPFIVVGDIETLLVPESTASHDLSKSGTTTINHHQPCSAGYTIISTDPKYAKKFKPKLFRGKHCVRYFLDSLQ